MCAFLEHWLFQTMCLIEFMVQCLAFMQHSTIELLCPMQFQCPWGWSQNIVCFCGTYGGHPVSFAHPAVPGNCLLPPPWDPTNISGLCRLTGSVGMAEISLAKLWGVRQEKAGWKSVRCQDVGGQVMAIARGTYWEEIWVLCQISSHPCCTSLCNNVARSPKQK